MVKNVLAGIPGIEYYPIVALILFVTFFAGLLVWFVRADKRRLDVVSRLPLDDGHSVTLPGKGGIVS
jgi:cytochrome c oxidase cbb3-type subunit IV